ncbi:aspartate-semialdehyde dehydrogenase [Candidatus Uhrbacteria bacterium]|nr:aspartate-semialdehyde dehydrogenase [Candidatus Uhrbacteria bacterium]
MEKRPNVAVVGATGAVGQEMIRVLGQRSFPFGSLRLLASERSAGQQMRLHGQTFIVSALAADSFHGIDIALFSAGAAISREFAPHAVSAGCVVIDNSSAFRMEEQVPLVVPEINTRDIAWHCGIIANPNCTTAIALMALWPLHRAFGLTRIFASTYQAVSGTGAKAMAELAEQERALVAGQSVRPQVYPHPIARNVIPRVDTVEDDGYTREEMKLEREGRKIMHLPGFRASVTCVRVPVMRAHSVAVNAEFERPASVEEAREVLRAAPGVELFDDPAHDLYPTPLALAGRDHCAVGRLRLDCALENGLAFWVVGDQLLKGAALNAVQIAEALLRL